VKFPWTRDASRRALAIWSARICPNIRHCSLFRPALEKWGVSHTTNWMLAKDKVWNGRTLRTKPMRIAHYIGTLGPGGAERQLTYMASAQRDAGNEVTVYCLSLDSESDKHFLPELVEHSVAVYAPHKNAADNMLRLFDNRGIDKLIADYIAPKIRVHALALASELLEFKPDILHCWLDLTNCAGTWAGLLAGVPHIICSFRSANPSNFNETFYPGMAGWMHTAYSFFARLPSITFLANAHVVAKDYADWLAISSDQITVVHNGLDVCQMPHPEHQDIVDLRQKLGIPKGAPVIAGIFRLTEEKRPFDFLQIIAKVRETIPDLYVVHVGIGELEADFVTEAKRLGIQDYIRLLGQRNDVPQVMTMANILLHCARSEGFSNVVLESSWFCTPPVTTRVGDMEIIVKNGESGFLHDVGAIDDMAASVKLLLNDPEKCSQFARRGHKHVRDNFPHTHMLDETMKLYCEVAKRSEVSPCAQKPDLPSTDFRPVEIALKQPDATYPHDVHKPLNQKKNAFSYQEPEDKRTTMNFINILACPEHHVELGIETKNGPKFTCPYGCSYPVIRNIPRFVSSDMYTSSFGLQWNTFRKTQLDSYSGTSISRERLTRLLNGSLDMVKGKNVLEAGCGAGRFTEILLQAGANVVAFDLSSAVDANLENCNHLYNDGNYYVFQGDILKPPFQTDLFDVVICIGVIQHTPCPEETIAALCKQVKPGGQLIIDHYTYGYGSTPSRQLLRKLLLQVPPETALEFCRELTDLLWPVHQFFFENKDVQQFTPFRNLFLELSPAVDHQYCYPELKEQAKTWSMLDTHDTLTDVYKHLRSTEEIESCLRKYGMVDINAVYAGNGVEARATKPIQQS